MTETESKTLPFEQLTPPIRQYNEGLGHFISMFSMVESAMQTVLQHFAGVDDTISAALFSGTRIDAASGNIKRIAEATKWPKATKLAFDEITRQLGEITQTRNDIIHYGVGGEDPTKIVISNRRVAHIDSRVRETAISPEIFADMGRDLLLIWMQLQILMRRLRSDLLVLLDAKALKSAWRYKPERRGGRLKKPRTKLQKRRRPPRPFEALREKKRRPVGP